ncbi:MAG: hypothetical protein V3W20_15025 [Candidatus Neomarinimicrobiota bacterium]
MKVVANIVSFISMIFGFLISVLAKWTHLIDDSITTIAGIIGLVGAIVWLGIALNKRKESKINLDNARIENQIKRETLKQLQSDESN